MNTDKFLVFSDLHYYPGCIKSDAEWRLSVMQQRAMKERCDFIVELGDFCHTPHNCADFVNSYNNFSIPSYHVIGNHDTEECSFEEMMRAYGLRQNYYYFDCNGFRFIALDPNMNLREDGSFSPYAHASYYKFGPDGNDHVPPAELDWLRETVLSSPYPCIVMAHQSFEYPNGVKEAGKVREIINEANKTKRRVLMAMNGHYHSNHIRILDNVCWFDINSATYDYASEYHRCYPEEIHNAFSWLKCQLIYKEPLSAVITIRDDGYIQIDGSQSEYYMGIDRTSIGLPLYSAVGRRFEPKIESARFVLQ